MNKTVLDFLKKNDVNPDTIDDYYFSIKSEAEINPILDRYHVGGKKIEKEVSIANILGYSYEYLCLDRNLIENLSHFFDENGSGYQKRSIGMITMDRDKCVETLKRVSESDTVYVRECENNKYTITTNGMHRFHILRFHYLNELSTIDKSNKEEVRKLHAKYTIPVEVEETDYIKTYSFFILRKIDPQIRIENEYDSNYQRTGKAVLRYLDNKKVVTDDKLLDLLQKAINNNRDKLNRYSDNFEFYARTLTTFRQFLEQNNIDLISQEATV